MKLPNPGRAIADLCTRHDQISMHYLMEAPILAVLAALDGALEATVAALLADSRGMDTSGNALGQYFDPNISLAECICAQSAALQTTLDAYRAAVVHGIYASEQRRAATRQEIPF